MAAIVSSVEDGSIAEELEIEAGDELLSIDGQKMLDMIDYGFYCKSELLTLEIKLIGKSVCDFSFIICKISELFNEPFVNLCDVVNCFC